MSVFEENVLLYLPYETLKDYEKKIKDKLRQAVSSKLSLEEDEKEKKKRKKRKKLNIKEALLAEAIAEKRAEMQQKLRDQDLGGGWNPLNQPVSE